MQTTGPTRTRITPEQKAFNEKAYTLAYKALEGCKAGKVTEELKELYKVPYRETVPWCVFPNWARPTDPVEGGHEG